MAKRNQNFNLQQMLSVFYSTPNDKLEVNHFEEVLQALIHFLKNKPEQLTPELLRFFYKYLSYKNEYSLMEILNLISMDDF